MRTTISKTMQFVEQVGWLRLCLFLATMTLGVLYIWQVNMAATAGYALRDLETEIEEYITEQDKLELEVARLQSVNSVTQRVQMLGLTEVERIEYIQDGGGIVAINR